MTTRHSAIIFDFDGTVALGHGPVEAYARAIPEEALDAPESFAKEVAAALTDIDNLTSPYRDGYHAVAEIGIAQGIEKDTLSRAYIRSRELLGTDEAEVTMPQNLPGLLEELAPHSWLVLATNAPATGVEAVLMDWGILQFFDQLSFNTGKPAGMAELIEGIGSHRILAIGDIDENDLAPAAELGADTLLVTPHHTLDDAAEDIIAWAQQGE